MALLMPYSKLRKISLYLEIFVTSWLSTFSHLVFLKYPWGEEMKKAFVVILITVFCSLGLQVPESESADKPARKTAPSNITLERNTHGNITLEGPTGLFLNPTSTGLEAGEFIAQYCVAILEVNDNNLIGHNAIASYGFTDWLEVGTILNVVDLDDAGNDQAIASGGPFARIRVLKETPVYPEFSLGGISLIGNDALEKHTLFFAGSKGLGLKNIGSPVDARLHVGVRQFWLQSGDSDQVGYFGVEIILPKHLYLVGEVSTEPDGATETPYSVGIQARHPEGYGLSLAAIQPGDQDEPGLFVGIGVNFQ